MKKTLLPFAIGILLLTGCRSFDAEAFFAPEDKRADIARANREERRAIEADRQALKSLYPARTAEFDVMTSGQLAGELKAATIRGDFAGDRLHLRVTD